MRLCAYVKKGFIIISMTISVFVFFSGNVMAMDYESYLYTEGFEGSTNPVSFWTTNGSYTVNEAGSTTAKAFSGSKSYVLDITINSGSYFYWKIPLPTIANCENVLNFSGRIWVDQVVGSPDAGLGLNAAFLPTTYSGCGAFARSTAADWISTQKDIVTWGKNTAAYIASHYMDAATSDNMGVKATTIGLFIYGSAGNRIRVYIDDLRLEGTVPTAASYDTEITNRWAPYAAKFNSKIDEFDVSYADAQDKINNLPVDLSAFEQEMKTKAQSLSSSYNLTAIRNRGWFALNEVSGINYRLAQACGICDGITKHRSGEITRTGHLLYNLQPTRSINRAILPDAGYIPARIDNEITVTTTPGEYEPASFVIQAFSDLEDLSVAVTDLTNGTETLPSSNIDIRTVKCWYQNQIDSIVYVNGGKTIVPELLLKDDSLINVENNENYAKVNGNYVWISDPTKLTYYCPANTEFPIQDSSLLQPVSIADNKLKQFWLTVNAAAETTSGTYTGYLTFTTPLNGEIGRYKITVNVLPFTLQASPLKYNLYYNGIVAANGTISSVNKNSEQYTNEMINMLKHGVTNQTVYQSASTLGDALSLRANAGITAASLYSIGVMTGNSTDPATLQALKDQVTSVRNTAGGYGITDVYCYGYDEVVGDTLLRQREAWEAVHEAGGKVFSSGFHPGNLALQYPWGKVRSWHLDETEGTIAKDSSGYGKDGTVYGTPAWGANGKIGTALSFNGSNCYVDCGNDPSLNITDAITVEAWVKPNLIAGNYRNIVGNGYESGTGGGYNFFIHSGNQLRGGIHRASDGSLLLANTVSGIFTLGQFYHVAMVFNGTQVLLYINGANVAASSIIPADTIKTTAAHTQIGKLAIANNYYFNGVIDEVRIYNRALRQDELYKNYQDGLNGKWTTVGDIKDLHIYGLSYNASERDACHAVTGHEIFNYSNPQAGLENPQIYRSNYGIKLWQSGYDGVMDYAYHTSFAFVWNDFDHASYRDHNFTYPTANGVIDTVQWEGFREGVDDVRYMATLESVISQAPSSDEKDAAIAFVDGLRAQYPVFDWPMIVDAEGYIRDQIIYHILNLINN